MSNGRVFCIVVKIKWCQIDQVQAYGGVTWILSELQLIDKTELHMIRSWPTAIETLETARFSQLQKIGDRWGYKDIRLYRDPGCP